MINETVFEVDDLYMTSPDFKETEVKRNPSPKSLLPFVQKV